MELDCSPDTKVCVSVESPLKGQPQTPELVECVAKWLLRGPAPLKPLIAVVVAAAVTVVVIVVAVVAKLVAASTASAAFAAPFLVVFATAPTIWQLPTSF